MRLTPQIALLTLATIATFPLSVAAQADTVRPPYGCFKVTANLAIKSAALGTSTTLAAATKGDILIKRRRFCYTIGSACAVTTRDGVQGYADRGSMKVHPCPAKLSIKAN